MRTGPHPLETEDVEEFGEEELGKTTSLMKEAIRLLAEMPENYKVFITGAHPQWLRTLERRFKEANLVDVVFMSAQSVLDGHLLGRRGALLIDDIMDLPWEMRDQLWQMQDSLKCYIPRRD